MTPELWDALRSSTFSASQQSKLDDVYGTTTVWFADSTACKSERLQEIVTEGDVGGEGDSGGEGGDAGGIKGKGGATGGVSGNGSDGGNDGSGTSVCPVLMAPGLADEGPDHVNAGAVVPVPIRCSEAFDATLELSVTPTSIDVNPLA